MTGSAAAARGNVPSELTTFIGRRHLVQGRGVIMIPPASIGRQVGFRATRSREVRTAFHRRSESADAASRMRRSSAVMPTNSSCARSSLARRSERLICRARLRAYPTKQPSKSEIGTMAGSMLAMLLPERASDRAERSECHAAAPTDGVTTRRSSPTISPFRIRTIRSQAAPTSGSWVTRMIVAEPDGRSDQTVAHEHGAEDRGTPCTSSAGWVVPGRHVSRG